MSFWGGPESYGYQIVFGLELNLLSTLGLGSVFPNVFIIKFFICPSEQVQFVVVVRSDSQVGEHVYQAM